MPPMWLSFINRLSEHCDIHFFHLNPCFSYWGDILTEKQAIKECTDWTKGVNDLSQVVGNPLLANLGQQGREFLSLIQQYSTFDIEVFDCVNDDNNNDKSSVLARLQRDILKLHDGRETPLYKKDDSIIITSAHTALREVQGLHDWLLHQFNQDPTLTPKDVLVMCPQIEHYAPYVNAVFSRSWQAVDKNIPPLPCSIADRISKDSEPLVAAFSELISLPDSRFQVSQVQAWLRIPAIQQKFSLTCEEIVTCFAWVEQASIHWGLNAEHKNRHVNSERMSAQFTWQYGLSRLLQGFAYADETTLVGKMVLLPSIEGDDSILLGKFMLLLEQLEFYALSLKVNRSPSQWHGFLLQLTDDFFDIGNDDNVSLISQAVEALVDYCNHANFQEKIPLAVVQDFLTNHFSQPDPGRQFMVGQVTFCSMLPMRSIPFKIVAILGLNDGEYPRQRQPLGFDLMSLSPARLGDRSRRGDDRYLFLEALISARKNLYLSYQGRNIKNNNPRQASIVLKELMEYLSLAYGWELSNDNPNDIRQLAMQAFSKRNYQGKFAGFDAQWLALSERDKVLQATVKTNTKIETDSTTATAEHSDVIIPLSSTLSSPKSANENLKKVASLCLDAAEVISFYQHSARYFARLQLGLELENTEIRLSDKEPFDFDRLASYLLKKSIVDCALDNQNSAGKIDLYVEQAKLNGQFPDLPTTAETLQKWRDDSAMLADYIRNEQAHNSQQYTLSLSVDIPKGPHSVCVELTTTVSIVQKKLIFYRVSSAKAKDFFTLYLHQLIIQVWQQQVRLKVEEKSPKDNVLFQCEATHGYYFDTKNQKISHFSYQQIEQPQVLLSALLENFLRGQHEPLLLSGELADKMLTSKSFEQHQLENFWCDPNRFEVFGDDVYIKYFWPTCPMLHSVGPLINELYSPIYHYRNKHS